MESVRRLAAAVLAGLVVSASTPDAQSPGASTDLVVTWNVPQYPPTLIPQFVLGDLTWNGCSPLYLAEGVEDGCPVFRDEPMWTEAAVGYEGPALVTLYPKNGRWVAAWFEAPDDTRHPAPVGPTIHDASGALKRRLARPPYSLGPS